MSVISVRVRKEVKEELERAGVNIAEEVRGFLEELARRLRAEREIRELDEIIQRHVKPSPKGFSTRSIREDRDEAH